MTLDEYRTRRGLDEFAALAGRLGISLVYLRQLAARQDDREPSPQLAVRIEVETGGAVSRRDLRPTDWSAIWPEGVAQ